MEIINTIEDLKHLSDEEILLFFQETNFRGEFSKKIRSKKNPHYYCGSIEFITIDGKRSNLCPYYLNVPAFCQIEEGPCEFNCSINLNALREKQHYIINVIARSLHNYIPDIDRETKQNLISMSIEERTNDLFERWGVDSSEFIGYYCKEEDQIVIKDLHKVNFDSIPYYPDDERRRPIVLRIPNPIPKIKFNDYYLFKWKLADKYSDAPFLIYIDFKFKPRSIKPKWFIDKLFSDRYEDMSKNFGSATNFLDTLSKQLSAKESTFVYELLQNANDYPYKNEKVDIEFHITENHLLFMHSGDYFNIRNISGICGINEKEKVDNKKAIGYKGIGFKTVFLNNNYVYLQTGDYSFRFDENAERIKRIGAPWPILPIWTDEHELVNEVSNVYRSTEKKFRVKFALRPRNPNILHKGKNSYKVLFKDIFEDSNIILFVPNINSVKVFINGRTERICNKNVDNWLVNEYEESISLEIQDLINKRIDSGKSRIPEKYKDFTDTKVSFACKKEGSFIKPIENGLLYCYLPTSASWGFPFLMNTDMIPKGDRDDIEFEVKLNDDINFNSELSRIAGAKFFSWIIDLLTSLKYELCSIFTLIPNFETCQNEHSKYYDDFILEFKNAFEARLFNENFIPVQKGFANIKDVIYDKTGLSAAGIITDEEFYLSYKEIEVSERLLPLKHLRASKDFKSFLNRYVEDNQKFGWEELRELTQTESFKTWLSNQENNNKFLGFLNAKNKISDFKDEIIFLGQDGILYMADELFYDIDDILHDLKCLETYLPHLSLATRKYFSVNKEWDTSTESIFMDFDADDFVDDILLCNENIGDVKDILQDKQNSYHFYKFLAVRVGFSEDYKSLPFYDTEGNVVDDFNNCMIYFNSQDGYEVKRSLWMDEEWITFISDQYCDASREYFKNNFHVEDFSHKSIIDKIIANHDYNDSIKAKIQEDLVINHAFVYYCFKQKEQIDSESLKNFALSVFDKDGDQSYENDVKIYFRSNIYETFEAKDWINYDWMYALDDSYFVDLSADDTLKFKKFLKDAFGVFKISKEYFYDNVVENHLEEIFNKISDKKNNLDFVKYLSENARLIFEERKDEDKFTNMPLLDDNDDIVTPSVYNYKYAIDDKQALKDIIGSNWFPENLVLITSNQYIKFFDNYSDYIKMFSKLGYSIYENLNDFFGKVLIHVLDEIRGCIEDLEENIKFHDFACSNVDSILPEHIKKLQQLPVFLYNGEDNPQLSDVSTGHYIISDRQDVLFELFNEGIIPPTEIDTVDIRYKKSIKYWGDGSLDNTPFTLSSFKDWSTNNERRSTFINLLNDDSEKNIGFWRWIKKNYTKDEDIHAFNFLPVIALDNEGVESYVDINDISVYISDNYLLEGKGLESIISKYYNDVLFISNLYIQDETEDSKTQWKDFFEKLGVKTTIRELIFDTIIPNLAEIEEESLPQLLSDPKYIDDIEDKWDELKSDLANLNIKTQDGEFREVSECIFIDFNIEKEPFKFLLIPNEIDRTYFEDRNTKKLLLKIAEYAESQLISERNNWIQNKVNQYQELQDNVVIEHDIHYSFINELANIDIENLKELEGIKNIHLLSRDDEYVEPETLTFGSIYNPICDFESNGIGEDSLTFISDSYHSIDNEGMIRKLFYKLLKVHFRFVETDIELLSNREFAMYFWTDYTMKSKLPKSIFQEWVNNDKFSNTVCIPTKDSIMSAEEIYSRSISNFVVRTKDWENKLPSESIPGGHELLSLLNFKNELDFTDSLNALLNIGDAEKRRTILNWMLTSYDERYDRSLVSEYRERSKAVWRNGKNELTQIQELYVLDPEYPYLRQYFSQDPRIINENLYFTTNKDVMLDICSMLQIPIIKDDDMQFLPIDGKLRNDILRKEFELKLLIAAGIADPNDYGSLFNSYIDNLNTIQFWECSSISLTYKVKPDISQVSKKFYHDEDDFYFVKKWDNRQVFDEFINTLQNSVNCDIDPNIFKNIFDADESIKEIVEEFCQDALQNDSFTSLLNKYNSTIIDELTIIPLNDDTDEDDSGIYNPEFIPSNTSYASGQNTEDDVNDSDPTSHYETITEEESGPHIINSDKPSPETQVKKEDTNEKTFGNGSNPKPQFPHKTESPHNDDFSENGNDIYSTGDFDKNRSAINYKPLIPQRNNGEITEWKKSQEQAKLSVADATIEELSAARELIDGAKTNDQIIDEHYLARYRLYYALTQKGFSPEEELKEFVNSKNNKVSTNKGYIYTRSAKGGILFISSFLWEKILNQEGRLCMYYGNKACDFEIIDNIDQLIEYVGDDNIIIQIKGKDKMETINNVFSGSIKDTYAHVLIRIKSNDRYNSIFISYLNNNENNDTIID